MKRAREASMPSPRLLAIGGSRQRAAVSMLIGSKLERIRICEADLRLTEQRQTLGWLQDVIALARHDARPDMVHREIARTLPVASMPAGMSRGFVSRHHCSRTARPTRE
jgi:hypothetical protein